MRYVDVLVVSDEGDRHGDSVAAEIKARGGEVARFNLGDVRKTPLAIHAKGLRVRFEGEWSEVGSATTVWWHRAGRVDPGGLDEVEGRLALDEGPHVLVGALMASGVRWVDDPMDVERAELKLFQLEVARTRGISVPLSTTTNDPSTATAFLANHRVIAKPLSPGIGIAPFVAEIAPGDADLVLELPVLLQELQAHAVADLRVVVVGAQAWVWRRERADGTVDWRADDPHGTAFELVVDEGLASEAVQLTGALKLSMSVQDWLQTTDGPVFLEANPQGAWLFLAEATALVLPAVADHLLCPPGDVAGVWPRAIKRLAADFLPATKAPANDGVVAPEFSPPAWAAAAAVHPEALDVARRAHDEAKGGALSAEEKAGRLLQTTLALLTIALAVGAFQVTLVFDRSLWWVLSVLPIGTAVVCLCLAAFESAEIDRVGVYRLPTAETMTGGGVRNPRTAVLIEEELGRRLAKWTSEHKHSDLMQARAWFSRGLAALVVAALVAGTCRAARAESQAEGSPGTTTTTQGLSTTSTPPPATTTSSTSTTTGASASTVVPTTSSSVP